MTRSKHRHRYYKQLRMLYSEYAGFVKSIGATPITYEDFQERMDQEMARSLTKSINPADEDISMAYYLARRKDGGPHVESIDGKCDRCGSTVYIDRTMAKMAFKAKEIICNECFPQISDGQTFGQLIAERLKELKGESL